MSKNVNYIIIYWYSSIFNDDDIKKDLTKNMYTSIQSTVFGNP